jgi:hypothetical protein
LLIINHPLTTHTMAKAKTTSVATRVVTGKTSRPGVHAKTKTSNNKASKNYAKKSRGQG